MPAIGFDEPCRIGAELLQAMWVAKVIGLFAVLDCANRVLRKNGHPANRIDDL
jgi:hypothetical protein